MSRSEVRSAVGVAPEEIEKSDTGFLTDFFTDLGVFCYYRAPDMLEAIEFGGPASPTLDRRTILGRPLGKIVSWFRGMTATMTFHDAGFRCPGLGVGVFAPEGTANSKGPVKGVIVFENGFYERRDLRE